MAQQLYDTCNVFKENCDRCFSICDTNIVGMFQKTPLQEFDINQTEYAQPLLFIIEYSLAQMWISWGIKPDVMMGHSIGEYVAATIAGVFSLKDALKLVSARGKLMGSLSEDGAMLAVFISLTQRRKDAKRSANENIRNEEITGFDEKCFSDVDSLLDRYHSICIAADNGTHLVLSGLKEDIDSLAEELESLDIKTQLLNVSHGFHSPLMQPMIKDFKTVADTVNYSIPKTPVISNITGELADENIATADYWIEHILQPVQFAKSIDYLDKQVNIFLEVGTKPTLRIMAESILDNKLCLHTLDNKQADWESILSSLSQLYTKGLDINWLAVSKNYHGNKISLPTYPFQRQRYWFDIPQEIISSKPNRKNIIHPLLGQHINSPLKQDIFQSHIQSDTINWLQDHRIEDKVVFPGTAYLEMAIACSFFQSEKLPLAIKNINITTPLYIDERPEIQLIFSPQQEHQTCEIYSLNNNEWQLHVKGEISPLSKTVASGELELIKSKFNNEINITQYYISCQQKGINYGKSFQGIKELYAKDKQALGLIELPHNLNGDRYNFHPALLDSCLQIIFAALPKELQTITYIPIGLDRFDLYSLPNNKVWSYLELKPASNDKILIADVWLYNEKGDLIAKLEGLKSQAIKSQPAWHNWLYQPQWKPQPLLTQAFLQNTGSWLIFADSKGIGKQTATKLRSQDRECHLVTRDKIEDNPQAFQNLIQQHPNLTRVIYLWSLDDTDNWEECKSYLYLVQALIQYADNPSLWYVTCNAQPVNNYQTRSGIKNSTLWGMQKAIALEHPELRCVGIDIDSPYNQTDIIFQEICAENNEQVAYRNNQRYIARLVRANGCSPLHESCSPNYENSQLHIDNPGNLDSLEWKSVTRQQPQDNEIEIEVKATGLNFRDVMVALDLYPDDTKFLGLECAGVVIAVGKEVNNFKPGDEVMAVSDKSFSQYLNVNSLLAIHKPKSLSFTNAATIPVTFLTAYYTLVYLAQLQPGEKILIHSAAGGVGIAAIQIAQNIGAEIYATASTPKWELLKSMGITKIMNSRSLNFASEIMFATDGEGVDVVLNSLSGEYIAKSIEVLNKHGRFIEIGKQGIWTKEDVAKVKPNIDYSIVDLWHITQDKPELIQQMLNEVLSQFTTGKLKPLPHIIFTSDKTIDAFRYMQQGKHQGKIIISMNGRGVSRNAPTGNVPTKTYSGTYLITGGMGAIGLKVAQWLTTKGVTNLVLLGRNDIKSEYKDSLQKIQNNAQVNLIKADIADTGQLAQALKQIESSLPPLRGVVHCAGVTSDRTIVQQDWNSFKDVLAPKVQGAWNLHQLTQKYDLESFIMFSSAASLIGSSGQANYCAANAFLDALAHARRSLGLPAISINWGAWANTGLASNSEITKGLKQKGIGSIKPNEGIEILEQLLLDNPIQLGVIPIDWDDWQKNNTVTSYYEDLVITQNLSENSSDYKQQLLSVIPEQRESLLRAQIIQQLGNILGVKDLSQIDLALGFSELGLDSLGSVELRNKLQSSYDIKLSQTITFDYPNITIMSEYLYSVLFNNTVCKQTNTTDNSLNKIENLSELEAETLLLEELKNFEL